MASKGIEKVPLDSDSLASRRINEEFKNLQKDPPAGWTVGLVYGDTCQWQATIMGPSDSPFSGGVFRVSIQFPLDYPFKPPKVSFQTKVFHPNISITDGLVYLDILRWEWQVSITISKVLRTICSMLKDPIILGSHEPEILHMYETDRVKYESTARSWTEKYAMGLNEQKA